MTETIRPARVIQAVRYLVNTELYRKHNISFDGDWLNQMGAEEKIPFIADESDREVVEELLRQHSNSQSNDEQEGDLSPGGHETLLENYDIGLQRIAMAPGEGHIPTNLTLEDLSFPTISCGEIFKGNSTYAKKAISQIRFYDRRCAVVPTNFMKCNEFKVLFPLPYEKNQVQ